MNLNKISATLVVSFGALTLGLWGTNADAKTPKTSSHHAAPVSTEAEQAAIRTQLSALTKELEDGDAVGLGFLWTIDGSYIDDGGKETKGRVELTKRFNTLFKENSKQAFELSPSAIQILSNNVAYCEGTVRRKQQGQKAVPETRFSMVFVKQDGNWLISAATETPIVSEEPAHDSLSDLSWLIGTWKAERDGGSVNMKADWTPNKNFIHCEYVIKKPDQPASIDIQILGWDPRKNQVISWNFDSTGGFASGSWYREGGRWVCDSTAVEKDGNTTRSINVFVPTGSNGFTWQALNRSVDGIALGDTPPLKVERVNQ